MTNTRLLKAKMVLNGDTIQTFANSIGVNRQNASIKINGKRDFKQSEMKKIAMRYNLTCAEFVAIFFDEGGFTNERKGVRRLAW